jgi:hypothetical protein
MDNREIGGNIVAVGFWTLWYLIKTSLIMLFISAVLMGIVLVAIAPPPPTKVELIERQQTHNAVMCATGFPEYKKYCE